jgi:hypothetical protein
MSLPILPLAALAALVLFGGGSSAQASAPAPAPTPVAAPPKKKAAKKTPSSSSSSSSPMPDADADIEAAARLAAATLEAQTIQRPSGGKVMVMPPVDITAQVPPPAAPRADLAPKPQPTGYNPQAARREAASLAAHLKRSGRANYDRRMLEAWQRKAGLIPDRIYGGASRGALRFYGVADPPPAFFPPTQEIPFVAPESR